MIVPKITWKRVGTSWMAWVGSIDLAHVVVRTDGSVVYSVTAVSTRWITKGYGEVRTVQQAKASVRRAWLAWWAELTEGEPKW